MKGAKRFAAAVITAGVAVLLALGHPRSAHGGGEPVPAEVAHRHGPVAIDEVAPLLAEAVRLSGLPALPWQTVPRVWSVSEAALHAAVCQQDDAAHCHGLQAAYDTGGNRILVLEWGRQRGAEWESFVVHELVHALQYAQQGAGMYADCESRRATEQQAYAVQDAYLQRRGVLLRVGSQMWWWRCPKDGNTSAARSATEAAGR